MSRLKSWSRIGNRDKRARPSQSDDIIRSPHTSLQFTERALLMQPTDAFNQPRGDQLFIPHKICVNAVK